MSPRASRVVSALGGIAGILLFAYALRRAGVSDILDGIRRVGWGLLIVLANGGLRFAVRAQCWRLCMPAEMPGARPAGFGRTFSAFLAGDAVGSVTPLGLLASEPTKVLLTRHHLAPREAVASLALENLVYAASVFVMIGLGTLVVLVGVPLPGGWRWAAMAALAALLAGTAVALRLMRGTWNEARGARPRWREKLAGVRLAVVGSSAGGRLWRVFALDLVFHALAVLEIYITLQWLVGGAAVTLAQAIVFETLNRVVTIVFKFVPFRVGVDEALSGALAPLLAVDPAAGVALAVVRKIRNLFWAGIGLAIVAAHPARTAAAESALGEQR